MPKTKYLPAEWAEQEFVQIILPNKNTDWAEILEEVLDCYANIALQISMRQRLIVVCDNKDFARNLLQHCNLQNISFVEAQYNDTWARDCSAITVIDKKQPVILDFTFNGWGLKFSSNNDNLLTKFIFDNSLYPGDYNYCDCRNMVLEGGSIESDGENTILTTSDCLLSENRNYLTQIEIERRFKALFGTERVLWLNNGYLAGDDTDSHIDTLARFCSSNTIAYVKCEDPKDEHFEALAAMEQELKLLVDSKGDPYHLVALPMADAIYFEGKRLPATYANFLIINGAVLMPTYKSPKDKVAKNILQTLFANRQIVEIDCSALIKQHGSLHCVTMQFPKPTKM